MTAAILSVVFLLWPLIALFGGQGFAPLAGLAALALFPLTVPRLRPRYYMLAIAGFFAYATLTALWSPRHLVWFDINPAEGDFNVRSELVKVGGLFIAIAVLMVATRRLDEKGRALVLRVAQIAFLVQLAIVALLTAFQGPVIEFLEQWIREDESVQNLTRNSQIMAAAAPFLILGLIEKRSPPMAALITLGVVGVEAALLLVRGVHAGLLALAAAGLSIAVVAIWRRNGFRILACAVALMVWTAPMFFGFLSLGADGTQATNSAEQRLAIWQRVVKLTADHPIEGSGIGVLRTIDEKIPSGVFKDQLVVPNHAHNMMLQLWAETGAIGALLVAMAILMAGWRLPAPERLGFAAPRVAALMGVTTAVAVVSFDLWNEWWWAASGFLAVLTSVIVAETAPGPASVTPRALLAYRSPAPPAQSPSTP